MISCKLASTQFRLTLKHFVMNIVICHLKAETTTTSCLKDNSDVFRIATSMWFSTQTVAFYRASLELNTTQNFINTRTQKYTDMMCTTNICLCFWPIWIRPGGIAGFSGRPLFFCFIFIMAITKTYLVYMRAFLCTHVRNLCVRCIAKSKHNDPTN